MALVNEMTTAITPDRMAQASPETAVNVVVDKEVYYGLWGAQDVMVAWGIDGWQPVDEEHRPPMTTLERGVLHTPMRQEAGMLVARLTVPDEARLDYGFLVTTARNGRFITPTWDGDYFVPPQTETAVVVPPHFQTQLAIVQTLATPFTFASILPIIMGLGTYLYRQTRLNQPKLAQKLVYLRDLLLELVSRDMKLRYKRSFLGTAWSVINPLSQLLVFAFIFQFVLPVNIPNYTLFLFIGILVWNWFSGSLYAGASVIISNPSLIIQPGFPVAILPIVAVASQLVHFLIAIPILLAMLLIKGVPLTATILLLPIIILLQTIFTIGLTYYMAAIQVTFRDIEYLLGIALMLGFYLTPVFYDIANMPEQYQFVYQLNPIVTLLNAYRAILLHGQLPNLPSLLILTGISLLLMSFGYRSFQNASYHFVEEL